MVVIGESTWIEDSMRLIVPTPSRRNRLHLPSPLLAFAALLALAAPACNSANVASGLVAAEACHVNSDCSSGLVCALGACRAMCSTAADCDLAGQPGGVCIDNGDVPVCEYAGESNTPCDKQSDCPAPLACASDYRCRNLCNTTADCNVLGITGRVCAKDAQGVYYCAQPSEVSQGELVATPPPGAPTTPVIEPDGGIGVIPAADAAVSIDTVMGPGGGTLGIGAAAITVPPDAIDSDVLISITPIEPPVSGSTGQVFEIEPSGTQFNEPATVTLSYANANLGGLPSSAYAVSTVVGGKWQALPGQIRDANALTISGTTTHLSPYALVAQSTDGGTKDATISDGSGSDSGACSASLVNTAQCFVASNLTNAMGLGTSSCSGDIVGAGCAGCDFPVSFTTSSEACLNSSLEGIGGGSCPSFCATAASFVAQATSVCFSQGFGTPSCSVPASPASPPGSAMNTPIDGSATSTSIDGTSITVADGYGIMTQSCSGGALSTTYSAGLTLVFTNYTNASGYALAGAVKEGSTVITLDDMLLQSASDPVQFSVGPYYRSSDSTSPLFNFFIRASITGFDSGCAAQNTDAFCGAGESGSVSAPALTITSVSSTSIAGSVQISGTGCSGEPSSNVSITFDVPLIQLPSTSGCCIP